MIEQNLLLILPLLPFLGCVVAASAPHRAEAFAACREAIDRIKETVPIWKKEWGPDETASWVRWDGDSE